MPDRQNAEFLINLHLRYAKTVNQTTNGNSRLAPKSTPTPWRRSCCSQPENGHPPTPISPMLMKFQPSITSLAQVLKGLPCLVALGLAVPMASMAETWNAATGNWNDPLNWTPNVVPTPGSGTAVIDNGGTVTLDSAVPNVDGLQLTGASILNDAT